MPDDNATNDNLKDLREQAKNSKANADRASLLERENAFLRAGIDTESKPAKALIAAYDGDLTTDAIRAEATDWGLFKAETTETPTTTPPATTEESQQEQQPPNTAGIEQQDMRSKLNGGGSAPPPEKPTKGGIDQAKSDFVDARQSGMPMDKALGLAVNNALAAGVAGDEQAKFDVAAWEAKKADAGHGAEFAH